MVHSLFTAKLDLYDKREEKILAKGIVENTPIGLEDIKDNN